MNIKPVVYESLTPRQRVIATVEAEVRGDKDEVKRLVNTCPRKSYTQADAAYTDTMQGIIAACMVVQAEIYNSIIGFLVAIMFEHEDAAFVSMQKIANVQAAWHEIVEAMGISEDTMSKYGPSPSPVLEAISDFMLVPDAEEVKAYREILERCLGC